MPKTNARVEEQEDKVTNLPQVRAGNPLAKLDFSGLGGQIEEDAGKGVSQRPEDNINPMVMVLQPNSPQCNAQHPAYIEGAEPGSFLLKNSPVQIIRGDVGFPFIPSAMELAWVEWVPRKLGGGFVAKHGEKPAGLEERVDPETDKKRWVNPQTKTEFIDTAYRYGLLDLSEHGYGALPFVIPFTSTAHAARREWETLMNSITLDDLTENGSTKIAPSFAVVYRVRTRQRMNKQGQVWYVPSISVERPATLPEYQRAKAFHESWVKGHQTVDASQLQDAVDIEGQATPF